MRRLLKWLAFLLLATPLALALLLLAASSSRPLIERGEAISPDAIAQAKRLLSTHDPRRQRPGALGGVALPATLLDEGGNYLAGRYLRARARLQVLDDAAEISLSISLAGLRYLNLSATVAPLAGKPNLAAVRLGEVPLPPMLIKALLTGIVGIYGFDREWQLAESAIQDIAFDPERDVVRVIYVWEPGILEQARAVAVSAADVERLREAQIALAALLAHRAPGSRMPLSELLKATLPVSGKDAGLRGRATLLVLAGLLANKDLATIVPAARQWPRINWTRIRLAERHDLAQHFVVSATLSAWSGEPIADAIGLYKELEDARRDSGFSFIDLAADRAGTRFGDAMINHPERLAAVLGGSIGDADLLPPVADLPEFLNADEFKRRFDSHESPQFKAVAREIERRLDTLALY